MSTTDLFETITRESSPAVAALQAARTAAKPATSNASGKPETKHAEVGTPSAKSITLTLPYPLSANRYWRPVRIGNRISIVPTKDAKAFKQEVAWIAKAAGVRRPVLGRVQIDVRLYPAQPKDWKDRQRREGAAWDDSVRCIDLDNANKVLLDALKGVAIDDDRWVRRIVAERMEPDAAGARVVLTITPMPPETQQVGLFTGGA